MESTQDVWQVLEDAPAYAEAVSDLFHWSTNYEPGNRPSVLFLDLIGWSEDELGQPMYDLAVVSQTFGYLELGKLAAALTEYADRPTEVREYVDRIIAADQ